MVSEPQYIGDGVYVSFDGYQIDLFTERDGQGIHIYLEPSVWANLERFVDHLKTKAGDR